MLLMTFSYDYIKRATMHSDTGEGLLKNTHELHMWSMLHYHVKYSSCVIMIFSIPCGKPVEDYFSCKVKHVHPLAVGRCFKGRGENVGPEEHPVGAMSADSGLALYV